MKVDINIEEIQEFLPHRYPMLLVDRVTEIVLGKSIQAYKNITPNVIPGGIPKKGAKVPLAGTRISRVRAAPIGGYRKTLATGTDSNGKPICCAKNNKNGFTQEIYKDTWTDCSGCLSGDKEGIVARPTRTKKPLIRSGMQYNAAAAPNNLRNTDETKKN